MGSARTLQDLVTALEDRGDAIALIEVVGDTATAHSAADIGTAALALARGLVADGLERGEPVVVFGPNTADTITVRLALAAAGALSVPIDDLATDGEVAVLLPDSGARLVFASRAHLPAIRAAGTYDVRLIDGEEADAPGWRSVSAESDIPPPALDPDDATVLVYTSGTTGTPKGFTLTHANILANVQALDSEGLIGPDDRVLMPLPLHHVFPYVIGLLLPCANGAAIVLPEAVRGPEVVQALKLGRATAMLGVPRLFRALLTGMQARVKSRGAVARTLFDLMLGLSLFVRRRFGLHIGRRLFGQVHRGMAPHLRFMASGGAHLEPDAIWTLEALGWPVYCGYGLAETASIFTANLPGRQRIGSEGRPLPGGELRIADPDAEGVGEIQLKGPNVFAGYRNNPEANREAFTEDGWFRTGDLGRIDADDYVFITGRLKEMIVLGGGKNVFPEELEAEYANPRFQEIAVMERRGSLAALVVPDMAAIAAGGSRRIEDVVRVALEETSQRLPSFQRVSGFAILREPLPRTRLGKIRRHLLPELYEAARAGRGRREATEMPAEDRTLVETAPGREIWAWLQRRFPDQPLALDTSPQLDLGVDSLEWTTLTLELQDRFGLRLDEEKIASVATLRDLLAIARDAEPMPDEPETAALSPEDRRWLEPPDVGDRILGNALYWLNRAVARVLFRLRARGTESVPADGGCIVAVNHLSDIDAMIVGAALPIGRMRRVRWGGEASRLFAGPLGRTLARAANIFPVDDRRPARSLAFALEALRNGDTLVWFPESWRSPDGKLQRFLPGIGKLALEAKVPVVPVRIDGTFEAMPRSAALPRPHPVRIVFGKPVPPAEVEAAGSGDAPFQKVADMLHDRVAELEP